MIKTSNKQTSYRKKVYTHESGFQTSAIIKNKKSYQFINLSNFGIITKKTEFCFEKHLGKASINLFRLPKNATNTDSSKKTLLLGKDL